MVAQVTTLGWDFFWFCDDLANWILILFCFLGGFVIVCSWSTFVVGAFGCFEQNLGWLWLCMCVWVLVVNDVTFLGLWVVFRVWQKVLVNSSFNSHQLQNVEANKTYNFKSATFFILGKLQILWRYLKFLRRLLYIFLRCLPKISSLFPYNYGGNVLNEVQPCCHKEDKNPEKQSQMTKKRKLVFLLDFNH